MPDLTLHIIDIGKRSIGVLLIILHGSHSNHCIDVAIALQRYVATHKLLIISGNDWYLGWVHSLLLLVLGN